jgi:hypothetical protein
MVKKMINETDSKKKVRDSDEESKDEVVSQYSISA